MTLKDRLAAREVVAGTFATLAAPGFVEVCGIAGFDFVVIDMEHAALGLDETEDLVRAAEVRGTTPLVRVPENSHHHILRALDTGALGVHVPDVNTVEEAEAAVACSKYGPIGSRGLAGVRASGYGVLEPLATYASRANQQTIVVAHIETQASVANLPALLEVNGIDVYYLGPVDLSNDLGVPGQLSDPRVATQVEAAISEIVGAGKIAGCIVHDLERAQRYRELGATYLASHALRMMFDAGQRFIQEIKG